jgi:hypothetical protein
MDFAEYGRNQTLDWATGNTVSPPSQLWVQLHVGDPGSDASANGAVETTRVQGAWGPADATGTAVNLADLDWLAVAATEIYSHVSIWDSPTGGNAWYQGPMTSPVPITVGSDFQIAAGQATIQHQ